MITTYWCGSYAQVQSMIGCLSHPLRKFILSLLLGLCVRLSSHASPYTHERSGISLFLKHQIMTKIKNYCERNNNVENVFLSKSHMPRLSGMDHLLHLRVDPDHPLVQIGMIPHQNVWIPCRSHKDCVHATPNGRHEDLTNLQPNQE